MKQVSDYLERELVPRSLIEKMLQHPSTDVYWVSMDEVSDLPVMREVAPLV